MLPVFAFGQQAQETIDRKATSAVKLFSDVASNDYLIATPFNKSYSAYYGSPFWRTDNWSKADIVYKGKVFSEPMLKYDCFTGQMLTLRYTEQGAKFLNLVSGCYPEIILYIDNIVISKNAAGESKRSIVGTSAERFVYHAVSAKEAADGISSGYFHYLIDRPVPLLCRYSCSLIERNGHKTFEVKEDFLLLSEGAFIRIRRLATIQETYPQWADAIERYAEQNTINKLLPLSRVHIASLIYFINTLQAK